jgi:hypothetical protein
MLTSTWTFSMKIKKIIYNFQSAKGFVVGTVLGQVSDKQKVDFGGDLEGHAMECWKSDGLSDSDDSETADDKGNQIILVKFMK